MQKIVDAAEPFDRFEASRDEAIQLCSDLSQTLKKFDCFGMDKDQAFMNLMERMLDFNPLTRISPIEILNHPYLK